MVGELVADGRVGGIRLGAAKQKRVGDSGKLGTTLKHLVQVALGRFALRLGGANATGQRSFLLDRQRLVAAAADALHERSERAGRRLVAGRLGGDLNRVDFTLGAFEVGLARLSVTDFDFIDVGELIDRLVRVLGTHFGLDLGQLRHHDHRVGADLLQGGLDFTIRDARHAHEPRIVQVVPGPRLLVRRREDGRVGLDGDIHRSLCLVSNLHDRDGAHDVVREQAELVRVDGGSARLLGRGLYRFFGECRIHRGA